MDRLVAHESGRETGWPSADTRYRSGCLSDSCSSNADGTRFLLKRPDPPVCASPRHRKTSQRTEELEIRETQLGYGQAEEAQDKASQCGEDMEGEGDS